MIGGVAAIAGIGATEFSKDSGRSELRLAAQAVQAALADAGLQPSEVDGLVTFTMDSNAEVAVARELGIGELRFFSQIGYGGGAGGGAARRAGGGTARARRRPAGVRREERVGGGGGGRVRGGGGGGRRRRDGGRGGLLPGAERA